MRDSSGFKVWFEEVVRLAKLEGLIISEDEAELYSEYYEDGDAPSIVVKAELRIYPMKSVIERH